jgi:NAD(P)-dependent dehydrogenase (short-subunit alcohol dehydrogenase family)
MPLIGVQIAHLQTQLTSPLNGGAVVALVTCKNSIDHFWQQFFHHVGVAAKAIAGQYASHEEMVEKRNAMCPTGRMGTGWDIAKAAAFLASDEAQYITGQCLAVDGGFSIRA